MNINSFKTTITCLLFSVSFISFAQKDFQGKAFYQSKTTLDMSNFGREDMSEERKKQIADRMKSMYEKTYILTFNQVESIYKEEEQLEAPSQGDSRGGRFRAMMSSFSAGNQYKNVKEELLLQDQEFFGKQFLIKDKLPKLEWEMSGETKQIGKYTCFKATALKTATDIDITSFRRPTSAENTNEDEKKEEETPKQVEVVVWYTMQIPVNQGPDEYWGLPGLILEVHTDKTTILCSKIIMNSDEKEEIKAPSKGKEVTKQEYNDIVTKKTEEMRANFRTRGGGPGGNRR